MISEENIVSEDFFILNYDIDRDARIICERLLF